MSLESLGLVKKIHHPKMDVNTVVNQITRRRNVIPGSEKRNRKRMVTMNQRMTEIAGIVGRKAISVPSVQTPSQTQNLRKQEKAEGNLQAKKSIVIIWGQLIVEGVKTLEVWEAIVPAVENLVKPWNTVWLIAPPTWLIMFLEKLRWCSRLKAALFAFILIILLTSAMTKITQRECVDWMDAKATTTLLFMEPRILLLLIAMGSMWLLLALAAGEIKILAANLPNVIRSSRENSCWRMKKITSTTGRRSEESRRWKRWLRNWGKSCYMGTAFYLSSKQFRWCLDWRDCRDPSSHSLILAAHVPWFSLILLKSTSLKELPAQSPLEQ